MPKVTVARNELFKELDVELTEDQFRDLCFEYGLELDDVTIEKSLTGEEETFYKIEVAANRYDLLCIEGLSQAIKIFLGKQSPPLYNLIPSAGNISLKVESVTSQVRPFVVAAVLRNLSFSPSSYHSFIELQEKLHQNICRKRTLVAIGTHDLDTLTPPFTYTALPPSDIKFKALNQKEEHTAAELMEIYSNDIRMKKYTAIIQDSPNYPLIVDANNTVLSMPPIINSDHSKITLNTKNVFIECTATDYQKALIVLNTIVAAFSKYCANAYTAEPVTIIYEDRQDVTPNFYQRRLVVSPQYINSLIGISVEPARMAELLKKMGLMPAVVEEGIEIFVPITRSDILHPCDIAEDVGIAYGYNNIAKTIPSTLTVGKEQPLNLVTDLLRIESGLAGYTEVLTFALHSYNYNYNFLRRPVDDLAVGISNPKALEFELPRTTLIPGILRTLATNTKLPLPLKVFEISDVVFKDLNAEVKAHNQRYLAAGFCGHSAGLENIHGLLDIIMKKLDFKWETDYTLVESEDPAFFPKRQVNVLINNKKAGIFGIIHPEVLINFGISFPVSVLELDIELITTLSRV
jgi:phenylalanyl-tRNA synthetase beta chain